MSRRMTKRLKQMYCGMRGHDAILEFIDPISRMDPAKMAGVTAFAPKMAYCRSCGKTWRLCEERWPLDRGHE